MDPLLVGLAAVIFLLICLIIGIPVGYSLALVAILGLIIVEDAQIAQAAMARIPYSSVVTYSLVIIPLFVLMGELATIGRVAEDAFRSLKIWLGSVRGSLSFATLAACGAFGAASGSSLATALTIGKPAMREMIRAGYDKRISFGLIAAGGTLGILIPPSITMIIYALVAEVSIKKMFLAGIIPGLVTILAYAAVVLLTGLIKPSWFPATNTSSLQDKIRSLPGLVPTVALALTIVAGLYSGIISLTEVAAAGAFVAFVFLLIRLRPHGTIRGGLGLALRNTVRTTAMLGMVLVGATLFSTFLAVAGVPNAISDLMLAAGLSELGFILVACLLFLAMGMFLETTAMMLLTVPFLLATANDLGIDTIWFGILFIKVAEIGLISPPVGMNVFVIDSMARDSGIKSNLREVFAGASFFIAADVVVITMLIAFPELVTWLPERIG